MEEGELKIRQSWREAERKTMKRATWNVEIVVVAAAAEYVEVALGALAPAHIKSHKDITEEREEKTRREIVIEY